MPSGQEDTLERRLQELQQREEAIERRERSTRETVRTLLAQYRALTDNATLGLVLMDERQHCTFLNPAAERIFGYTLAEVQGRPLHDFVHHKHPDGTPYPIEECPIDRALPTRMQEKGEDVFIRPDGTFYPVAFTASPLLQDGVPVGTVIEVRDITDEKRAVEMAARRARHAALLGDVGAALTRGHTLRGMLQHCAEAMVRHLDAAFARVWTLNAADQVLELQASAGMYTHIDGPHARVPVGRFKIGLIAEERKPHLTNDVLTDPRVGDQDWARREGMVAFAGYPLLLEGRVIGVAAMFARRPLDPETLDALASVADSIALGAERLRMEEALRESERRFRNMADNAPVMLWVTDPTGACTYLSRGWYDYTGQTEETALGHGWLEAVHPDDAEAAGEIFINANARHEAFRLDYRLRRGDGTYRWAIDSASPRFGLNGEYLGYIGSVIDIEDRKAAEEEVHRLNATLEQRVRERTARIEEVNRELEAFSYSVSHDLRAPLRHITGFAQMLEKRSASALDDKSRGYLKTISEAAQKGGQLVDELLAFSRLGRTELKREPIDLAGLLDEARRELEPDWTGRSITWRILPLPPVEADPTLVQAMLKNLLSNALKYTRPRPEAIIEVGGRLHDREVEVYVKDNGVGFDMAYADKLFGVFQRLHTTEQFEGTGIGLANVRRIVLRHGGRVWAEGRVDEGAIFSFTLPAASADGPR